MVNPLPAHESQRIAALAEYRLLDTAPEDVYDDIVRIAAFICSTPTACVSLIDTQRQWFKAKVGHDITETPRSEAFCAHTILQNELMIVPDAARDDRFKDNPSVTGAPYVRFYAGMPLITESGHALGTLCVTDSIPRRLTSQQVDALRTLARQTVAQMELRRRIGIQEQMTVVQKDLRSEREHAVIAQRQSETRFQIAFENAAFGASIFDLEGRFLSVNNAFCTMTDYPEAMLRATNFMTLTHPDDLAGCLDQVKQLQAGQIPSFVTQKRFLRKDGRAIWVENNVSMLHNEQGRPEFILALTEDLTERKMACQAQEEAERAQEDAKQAQEQSLQRTRQVSEIKEALHGALTMAQVTSTILQSVLPLFQTDKGLIVLLSEDGTTLRAAQVAGMLPAHWREFPIDAHHPFADAVRDRRLVALPADRAFTDRHVLPETRDSKATEEQAKSVLLAVPLQGSERCIGGMGMICSPEHIEDLEQKTFLWALADQCAIALERAQLYDAAQREVGGRHQLEERLLQYNIALQESQTRLVEAQHIGGIGSWEVEISTKHVIWSAEMFQILGFDPAQGTPTYEQARSRIHPDDLIVRDRLYAHAVATGKPFQYDMRLLLPDGVILWYHLIGRPEVSAEGVVTRIAETLQDITERVEREQCIGEANIVLEIQKAQLEEANAKLEAANVELATLAATDPLTGLLNYRAFQMRISEEIARAQRSDTHLAIAILDLDGFRYLNDVYGHAVGDIVLRQVADSLRKTAKEGSAVARFGSDEFIVLIPDSQETTPLEIEARLHVELSGLSYQPTGNAASIPITAAVGAALYPRTDGDSKEACVSAFDDHGLGDQEILRRAEERLWRAKTGADAETKAEQVRAHALRSLSGFSMLDALVTAVDNKDRYTRRHSEDVLDYALLIARELGLTEAEQRTLGIAALLHDVGKIGVPDAILRKPGTLTDEEYEAIKRHAQMGAVLVQAVPGLEDILDAVCHHHERWDGGGYPFGLRGTETPLLARLLSVADAFSAMTTDRPYRKGIGKEQALSVLEAGMGAQWDRRCVDAFLTAFESGPDIGIGE